MKSLRKTQSLPVFRLTLLAVSLLTIPASAFAMQELNEQALRQVDGRDGVVINTAYDSISLDSLYWEDKAGMANGSDTALRGYVNNLTITGSNLGATYKLNAGADAAGKPSLDFLMDARLGTMSADSFKVCDGAGSNCGSSMGGLTVQSLGNTTVHLVTTDGFLNQAGTASFDVFMKRLNIFLTQLEVASNPLSTKNQLILKDFNFNISGTGRMYVDAKDGFVLETGSTGQVNLERVCILASCATLTSANSKPGLNIDLVMKASTGGTFDATTNTKGLIRVGASGLLKNASITFRGVDGLNAAGEAALGKAFSAGNATLTPDAGSVSLMGSTGLVTRLKTDFTSGGANPTTFELGHGGDKAYALSFSNFTPLLVRAADGGGAFNPTLASLDTGSVYINLADTKRMQLPTTATDNLRTLKFGTGTLTTAADYSQQIHDQAANPKSVIVAARGTSFQALSRQTTFVASPDVTQPINVGTWGLGLPIYNLNANVAIYGTTFTGTRYDSAGPIAVTGSERIGFALGLSTEGVNSDGSKTTSILLIDGKKYHTTNADVNGVRLADPAGDPINYYIGVRNIDMLMSGYGSFGLEGGRLNIQIPQFMLAAAGEVAVGYLPGSQYKTLVGGSPKYALINGFKSNKDVLFGLRLRMAGSVDMTMVPGGNTVDTNFISFEGNIKLTDGAVQLVEPIDSSIVGYDKMTGSVGFKNAIKINDGNVDFNTEFTINPSKTAADVFRVRDLNLYPANAGVVGSAQRLGEMVFTGGKITSQFNIAPH